MEKEDEEIELPSIFGDGGHHTSSDDDGDDGDDDYDDDDFYTPTPQCTDIVPPSPPSIPTTNNESKSSPRYRKSPRRSSLPYHQRIAGGTMVGRNSKQDLGDLMNSNAGNLINLAAIEEGKEELEDLENEIERRKENLLKGVAVQNTLRRRRVRRRRRKRNIDALGNETSFKHQMPKHQLSKFKMPTLQDVKLKDIKYVAKHIIKSHRFDKIILVVVVLNVLALCVQTSLHDSDSNEDAIKSLFWFQFLCLLFYTVEAFFKIVLFQCEYFRSGWDVLDFTLVLIDWIIVVFASGGGGFSALRVLRVLRTLRAVSHFPKLKALVLTLLSSVKQLGSVVVILLFLIGVFAILGLQLFLGSLHNRCVLRPGLNMTDVLNEVCNSNNTTDGVVNLRECRTYQNILYDKENTRAGSGIPFALCSTFMFGGFRCPESHFECVEDIGPNPYMGLIGYDNIIQSSLTVFCEMTLSNWSYMMYSNMRSWNLLAAVYYVLLITLIGIFAINLILAVISNNLSIETSDPDPPPVYMITDEAVTKELKTQRRIFKSWLKKAKQKKHVGVEAQENRKKSLVLRFLNDHNRVKKQQSMVRRFMMGRNNVTQRLESSSSASWALDSSHLSEDEEKQMYVPEWIRLNKITWTTDAENDKWFQRTHDVILIRRAIDETLKEKNKRENWLQDKHVMFCWTYTVAESVVFQTLMMALIVLNTISLSSEGYHTTDEDQEILNLINLVCTVMFSIEIVVLIIAYGPKGYAEDPLNLFDAAVVFVSIAETIVSRGSSGGLATAFRALRVIRVVRISRFMRSLRILIGTVQTALPAVGWMILLMVFCIFVFGLMGTQLFRDVFKNPSFEVQTLHPYETIFHGSLNIFQVITLDNWPSVMADAWKLTNSYATVLFFVVVVVVGNFLFYYQFIAIVISAFESQVKEKLEYEEVLSQTKSLATYAIIYCTRCRRDQHQTELKILKTERIIDESAWHGKRHRESSVLEVQTLDKSDDEVDEETKMTGVGSNGKKKCSVRSEASRLYDIQNTPKQVEARVKLFVTEFLFVSLVRRRVRYYKRKLKMKHRREIDVKPELEGKSCGCLDRNNQWRKRAFDVCISNNFENAIAFVIMMNCAALAMDYPAAPHWTRQLVSASDIIFCIIFNVEATMRIVALGFYKSGETRSAYLEDGYNVIDFLVVIATNVSLFLTAIGSSFPYLRIVRALRPLRVIVRFEKIRVVVDSLMYAVPSLGHVMLFCALFWLCFSIIGVQFFQGALRACHHEETGFVETKTNQTYCELTGGRWINRQATHFDNVSSAFLFLFTIATGDSWYDYVWELCDAVDSQYLAPLYFVLFIFTCSFFQLELFVGVVVDTFARLKDLFEGTVLLTKEQRSWANTSRLLTHVTLRRDLVVPKNQLRRFCWRLCHAKEFDNVVTFCIIINTVVMCLPYHGMSKPYEWTLFSINSTFVLVFVLEAGVKITGTSFQVYWMDSWNRFDFIVVLLSIGGYPIRFLSGANVGGNVIRIFRVARVFRLIKGIPTLQNLFDTLVMSMSALWNVSSFILVVYFIFAVAATEFFGRVQFDPDYLTKFSNFRHVAVSMLTLFRVSTADDWTRISVGCALRPPQCDASCPTESHDTKDFCECGHNWAPWFFVIFVITTGIVLLNLFVAVVLDAFSKSNDVLAKDIFFRTANLWALTWQSFDIEGTGIIGWRSMYKVLEQSPAPWGFGLLHVREVDRLRFVRELNLPMYTRAQVHNQTHIFRQNTTSSAAVRDVTLSKTTTNKDEEKHYYALFRPSLLAMVKFVGFPNVSLDEIKKEAEQLEFHFCKGRTRVYMHQVLAAEMIQDWVRHLRKGVRNRAKVRAEQNMHQQRKREENIIFKRAIATYKMYGSAPAQVSVRNGILEEDLEESDEENEDQKAESSTEDVKLDVEEKRME